MFARTGCGVWSDNTPWADSDMKLSKSERDTHINFLGLIAAILYIKVLVSNPEKISHYYFLTVLCVQKMYRCISLVLNFKEDMSSSYSDQHI